MEKIKIAIFLFFIFLIIYSNMFQSAILKNIPGALNFNGPTEKGVFIGGFLISVSYLGIDFLVRNEII